MGSVIDKKFTPVTSKGMGNTNSTSSHYSNRYQTGSGILDIDDLDRTVAALLSNDNLSNRTEWENAALKHSRITSCPDMAARTINAIFLEFNTEGGFHTEAFADHVDTISYIIRILNGACSPSLVKNIISYMDSVEFQEAVGKYIYLS